MLSQEGGVNTYGAVMTDPHFLKASFGHYHSTAAGSGLLACDRALLS